MKKEIAVQIAGVSSNQEWTTDPDMIEVVFGADLLERAEKSLAFMQENDINYVCRWWSFSYTLYELAENVSDDDLKDKTIIQGTDGQSYVEFEPEYRLDGCHAKIFKDGCIRAVLPFKNTSDELWFDIGHISDLKQRMGLDGALFAEGTAEWFKAKYDGQEHPEWPRSDWQYEVSNGDTTLGYWEWVAGSVESDEADSVAA